LFSDDGTKISDFPCRNEYLSNTEGFEIVTGCYMNPSVTLVLQFKLLPKTALF